MKKIELLFPELCNLYGERYNVTYLQRCCPEEIQVIETNHKDEPAFAAGDVDMVYLGCMTERKQETVLSLLRRYKHQLQALMDKNVLFLATGNAVELFGREIRDGERAIEGMGLFDFCSVRYMKETRHNSQFIGVWDDLTLLGHRSQFSFSYGDFEESFIHIQRGIGMNPDTDREGLHINNFFATYSLGSFLILNPHFAKRLLEKLGLAPPACALNRKLQRPMTTGWRSLPGPCPCGRKETITHEQTALFAETDEKHQLPGLYRRGQTRQQNQSPALARQSGGLSSLHRQVRLRPCGLRDL
ncbi:MAG: hypothetical protein LUG57_08255 [Oscillospiraceae bacterium]|nr:hypothetical protein [Oscillospiraceae bacterium]